MLSRSIEQFPALELATILLKEASESGHLLLSELFGAREHAVELRSHLLLSSLLLFDPLLLLFFFLQLSFLGLLALPLFLSFLRSLLVSFVLKYLQPSFKISALSCKLPFKLFILGSKFVNLLLENCLERGYLVPIDFLS